MADLAVKKTVMVQAPVEEAFRTFTEGIDRWWLRSHKIGTAGLQRVVMENHPGGRWYELDDDGTECHWGRVLDWDPPHRLVLAWQIDANMRFDPDLVTEVEVRFSSEGAERTRVDLAHHNLGRFGDAEAQIRMGFESPSGWQGLLDAFAEAAAG